MKKKGKAPRRKVRKVRKGLSVQEQRFVDAYLGEANGNATQAARLAGYNGDGNTLKVQGHRLLTSANVRQAIQSRLETEERRSILDADSRDELLSTFALMPFAELRDRIRAISELNKCSGRHSSTIHHKGRLTLEQAMEASRAVRP